MKIAQILTSSEESRVFRVVGWDQDDFDERQLADWEVVPLPGDVLTADHGFFLLRGHHVLHSGDTEDCLVDISMPERISDFVYFARGATVTRLYHYECEGEVIPAVPIDGFGLYELFYSRRRPDIGIAVLREGLILSHRKAFIAEDLGYILRDEGRLSEAAEAFSISAAEGPSSHFIFDELADLLEQLGRPEDAKRLREKGPASPTETPPASRRWRFWKRD